MKQALQGRARFGPFELDPRAGELHFDGQSVILQDQQLKVLLMLIEREGEIATREEIKKRLWPNDTIVEFDYGINNTIKNLRRALGDSADEPRFIETIPRRGYRLIVPVEWVSLAEDSSAEEYSASDESSDADSSESADSDSEALPKAKLKVGRLTGKVVSHYRVLEVIGGGGMGLVYRAEDLKLGRAVALKFLPEEVGDDPKARERFEREAHAVSALDHPNICTVYDFDEHAGHPFIAMQLLQGKTLRDHLADGRFRLTQPEGLEIAIQIASGLEAAHEKGIIHRDIKPANIFITEKNVAKILDFGVAKVLQLAEPELTATASDTNSAESGAAHLTRTGMKLGTAGYMSPEQIRGEPLDARTDIFSFGLVLYEMATGERAFTGETEAILHDAILNREPEPVRELAPETSSRLAAIIDECLAKEREQRFQGAADIRVRMEDFKADTLPGGSWKGPRRFRLPAVIAILLLAVAIGSFYYWRSHRAPNSNKIAKEQAGTSSPEALQAFTEGQQVKSHKGLGESALYFQRAIDLDPSFSEAYLELGVAHLGLRNHELGIQNIRKAYDLRTRATPSERALIEGMYFEVVTGELEKAVVCFQQAARFAPASVHQQLATVYVILGQFDRAAAEGEEFAKLVPDSGYLYLVSIYVDANRFADARRILEEARSHKIDYSLLRSWRYTLASFENDTGTMQEVLTAALNDPQENNWAIQQQGDTAMYHGQYRAAQKAYSTMRGYSASSADNLAASALFALETGNPRRAAHDALQALKLDPPLTVKGSLVWVFALTGNGEMAEKMLNEINQQYPLHTIVQNYDIPTLRAAIELGRNNSERAIEILQIVFPYDLGWPPSLQRGYSIYLRGLAYLKLAKPREAAAEFQKMLQHTGMLQDSVISPLSRLQLARAQAMAGDKDAARKSYQDFLTLWKDADPDIPIYQQAKREYAKLQ